MSFWKKLLGGGSAAARTTQSSQDMEQFRARLASMHDPYAIADILIDAVNNRKPWLIEPTFRRLREVDPTAAMAFESVVRQKCG